MWPAGVMKKRSLSLEWAAFRPADEQLPHLSVQRLTDERIS
jgi:hypothetical protein